MPLWPIPVTIGGMPFAEVPVYILSDTTTVEEIVVTDENGAYRFEGLANGEYIISPNLKGYLFTPTPRNTIIANESVENADFEVEYATEPVIWFGDYITTDHDNSLDDLSGFKTVTGDLEIETTSSVNFDEIGVLTSVGGDFYIGKDLSSGGISGLGNITSIGGSLTIYWNTSVDSLEAFGGVTTLEGDLIIEGALNLPSLEGLHHITSVGGDVVCRKNHGITDMEGLRSLTSVGGLMRISTCSSLASLDGLENLISVEESVSIVNNDALENLEGLYNVSYIGDT